MSGKKQILLLFILLLTLCACKPKPLSYEITFQKEEALEQVVDELAFTTIHCISVNGMMMLP